MHGGNFWFERSAADYQWQVAHKQYKYGRSSRWLSGTLQVRAIHVKTALINIGHPTHDFSVHLPECDTNTMEGRLAIRPWRVGIGLIVGVTQSSMRFCTVVIHRVIQTICSAHRVHSTVNNNGHVHDW